MGLFFGDSESICKAECPIVPCPSFESLPEFQCQNISCPKMEIPSLKFCSDVIKGDRSCAEIKFPEFKCPEVACPKIPEFPNFQCPSTSCSDVPMNCPECFDNSMGLVIMVTVLVSLIILLIFIYKIIEMSRRSSGQNGVTAHTTGQTLEMAFINESDHQLGRAGNTRRMNASERMPEFVLMKEESQALRPDLISI